MKSAGAGGDVIVFPATRLLQMLVFKRVRNINGLSHTSWASRRFLFHGTLFQRWWHDLLMNKSLCSRLLERRENKR